MKILIGDDHNVVRRGLKMIILDAYPKAIIVEAEDGAILLQKLGLQQWDIIICDISMPGRSGLEIMQLIKDQAPKIPVVMLSMHPAEHYAIRALKAGAHGYITKESASDELILAIKTVTAGRKYITQEIADLLIDNNGDITIENQPHKQLSNREFDVMKMIAEGYKISDIATRLSLSVNTISTYRTRILQKMCVDSNADITKYALDKGII
jgi:two-component system, NarL family, invasion response regulator UvrY